MWNITLNTFREIVRNKFLYMILFFAFIFIVFSITLGKLTIGDDNKIIVDFWLAMIEFFWLIGVLFVWSQLLFKEIEWKTIFLILSKPIKRWEFILGKFFWFSLSVLLIILFQWISFLLVLFFKKIEIDSLILFSIFFTFLKLETLLSLVFFFSTFMSNILTILVSMMMYFISHSFSLMIDLMKQTKNEILLFVISGLQFFFPPFEALNIKDFIGSFKEFSYQYFLFNSFYSFLYIFIILFFTILIFNKKSFER